MENLSCGLLGRISPTGSLSPLRCSFSLINNCSGEYISASLQRFLSEPYKTSADLRLHFVELRRRKKQKITLKILGFIARDQHDHGSASKPRARSTKSSITARSPLLSVMETGKLEVFFFFRFAMRPRLVTTWSQFAFRPRTRRASKLLAFAASSDAAIVLIGIRSRISKTLSVSSVAFVISRNRVSVLVLCEARKSMTGEKKARLQTDTRSEPFRHTRQLIHKLAGQLRSE